MHIEALTIQGFKSFPDRVKIEFRPGITAIVGPNGSGKSNVSEAVRWVLGEQSARSLRGDSMQDVIFNGTQSRQRLGFAEVSLDFKGVMHLGLGTDALTVTRRYYRSGDSEYLLNGELVRLKDISELFADTGIGKKGYSFISQGKVDELLHEQGDERRKIFDEAAGIVKLKLRRKEAMRRLVESRENLNRSADALTILRERYEPLSEAAEKLKIYRELEKELKRLDLSLAVSDASRSQAEIEAIEEQLSTYQNDLDAVDRQVKDCQQRLAVGASEREELEERLESSRRQEIEDRAQGAELQELEVRLRTTAELYKRDIDRLQTELTRLQSDYEAVLAQPVEPVDFSADEEKLRLLERDLGATHKALDLARDAEIEAEFEATEVQRQIAKLQDERLKLFESRAELRAKVLSRQEQSRQDREKRSQIDLQIAELEGEKKELEQVRLGAEVALEKAREAKRKSEERATALFGDIREARRSAQEAEISLTLLQNAEREFQGYRQAYKRLRQASEKEADLLRGLIGPLGQLIEVDSSYEQAVERALGAAIHYLVVESKAEASRLIDWLKEQRAGRETFIPLDHFQGQAAIDLPTDLRGEASVLGVLSTYVNCDSRYRGIVDDILGRIVLVEDLPAALALQSAGHRHWRLVTLAGELLHPSGSVTGGIESGRNWDLLARRNALHAAERELEELQLRLEVLTAEQEANDADLASKSHTLTICQEDEEVRRREIVILETRLKEMYQQRESQTLSEAEAGAEEALQESLDRLESELEILAEKYEQARESWPELEAQLSAARAQLRQAELRYQEENSRFLESKSALQECQSLQSQYAERLAKSRHDLETKSQELKIMEERLLGLEREREESKIKILAYQTEHSKRQAAQEVLEESLKALLAKREELYQMSSALQSQRQEIALQMTRAEAQRERRIQTLQSEKNRLWEQYELSWQEVLAEVQKLEAPQEVSRRDVNRLRQEIKELGEIQAGADRDFIELQERVNFLEQQHADLEKSQREVEGLIQDLELKMLERFNHEFENLRVAFAEVFAELFQGGSADLVLLDPEDLDSPIEIKAQPPGKKLQNLSLLSGGERALTAIAVLFALFKLRPAPFAILDEVESALDEANIDRFTAYLRRYIDKTQFILITHRKNTMAVAERLYGVSMRERGVSHLLSLEPESLDRAPYLN